MFLKKKIGLTNDEKVFKKREVFKNYQQRKKKQKNPSRNGFLCEFQIIYLWQLFHSYYCNIKCNLFEQTVLGFYFLLLRKNGDSSGSKIDNSDRFPPAEIKNNHKITNLLLFQRTLTIYCSVLYIISLGKLCFQWLAHPSTVKMQK